VYGTHARVPEATHGFDVVSLGARVWEVPGDVFCEALQLESTGGLAALTSPALRRALVDLFSGDLSAEGVLRLAGCFRPRAAAKGDILLSPSETPSEWWVVESGSVRYGERALGPGDDFALDALLLDAPVY